MRMNPQDSLPKVFSPLVGTSRSRIALSILGWTLLMGTYLSPCARAASPTLGAPTRTPQGNLRLTATGDSGTTGLIEVSPNLVDWMTLDRVTWGANGAAAAWYLRPQGERLFSRVRIPETFETPTPFSFTAVVNPDFRKSTFVTDQGGLLKLTDDNGWIYQAVLPSGALMVPEDVVLEVINEAHGLPEGMTYLGGVRLSPAGRRLVADATIVITLPEGVDATHLLAIAWQADGSELHLVKRSIQDRQITIPISHMRGIGLVQYQDLGANSLIATIPTALIDQIEHAAARGQLGLPMFPDLPPGPPPAPSPSLAEVADPPCAASRILERVFQRLRIPELSAAIANDALLEDALFNWLITGRAFAEELALPCNASAAALADHCDDLAILAIEHSIDLAVAHCKQHDLRALVRLWRDARWSGMGTWGKKFGPAQRSAVLEKLRTCAQFRLEIFSSTAYTSKAGTVTTSVSSTFPLRMGDGGGSPSNPIRGSGEVTLDATDWLNPVSPCIPRSSPSPGQAAVFDLFLLGFGDDLNRLVVHTDADIPRPQYGLLLDPLVTAAAENYVLTCQGFPVNQGPSFWGTVFGAFHKDRIRKLPDGRQAFWFLDWTYTDDNSPEHKDFLTQGTVGSGQTGSETTVLNLYFTGGSE